MTDDELIAKGNAILTRFVQAQGRLQRIGVLAGEMLKRPMSPEMAVELTQIVTDVKADTDAATEELAIFTELLAHRRNVN
jgi:hypothetical protein